MIKDSKTKENKHTILKMKHLHRHIFTLSLISLLLAACQEDTITPDAFGSLDGLVLFETDNSALENVTISTSPPTSTVITNSQGQFTLEDLKVGTYTIRAEKAGFSTAIESITISEGKRSNVVIKITESDVANNLPMAPFDPSPANAATGLGIEQTLAWRSTDVDEDSLTYDVYLFNSNQSPTTLIAENLTDSSFTVENLRYGTTYFWQVAVKDGIADPVFSEVWSFSTTDFPAHPFVFAKITNSKYDVFAAQSANPALPLYQLTDLVGSNYRPRISPSGNRVAFLSNSFPNTQLFTVKRDGTELTLVEAPIPVDGNDKLQLDFCWSPDGTQLLFMNEQKLFKINLDGTGFAQFAELANEEFVEVDWSGVTGRIAARTVGAAPYQSRILLYDSNGTLLQEVVSDLPGNIGGPAFSVDGNSILYTHDVDGLETLDGRQLNSHVFLKNLTTGATIDLSVEKPAGFNDLDARFSPNGALVIFVQTDNVPNSQKDIYMMNLEGEFRTKLFENAEMPDWR